MILVCVYNNLPTLDVVTTENASLLVVMVTSVSVKRDLSSARLPVLASLFIPSVSKLDNL